MKFMLKAEELMMFAISVYGITRLDLSLSWWLYPILFLAPDIGMAGYAINPRVGAFTYNLLHHKGLAIIVLLAGIITGHVYLTFTGLLLFGHSSFDRILGYGLKYPDNFGHTHLGKIGSDK